MSEHTWTEEHVATYLAGGLTAQEAERLEAHANECASCDGLLNTSRGLEREMNCLFFGVRPGPELEDRLVNNLRNVSAPRKSAFVRWSARSAAAVAAVLMLGAFGMLANAVAENGLPMPGSPQARNLFSHHRDRVETVKVIVAARDLTTGTAFTKQNVGELTAYKEVPKTSLSPEAKLILNPDDLVGKRLSRSTHEGEFFNVADVNVKTQILFEPNKDIISLPMTAAKAAAGFVGPGSRVDIVGSVIEGNTRRVFTVLPDVHVLAVNGAQDLIEKQTFPDMSMVSFPVSEEEAKLIALANQQGANLELLLRHPDAPPRHPTPEARENARKDTLALLSNLGREETRPLSSSSDPKVTALFARPADPYLNSFTSNPDLHNWYAASPDGKLTNRLGGRPARGTLSPGSDDKLAVKDAPVDVLRELSAKASEGRNEFKEYYAKTESNRPVETKPAYTVPQSGVVIPIAPTLTPGMGPPGAVAAVGAMGGQPVTGGGQPPTPAGGEPAPTIPLPAIAAPTTPAATQPAKKDPVAEPNPEPSKRVILRSGNMEFEVPSFDAATASITKSVLGLKGAFIATVNSDKLPNGKVKGSITVRTPPEHLDTLVLELRKELGKDGELKGVRISSQDVTKQYTDLESHLRAYRTMETRLIQIIKEGKGEIKQLLEAERELGIWRTKIEETEGELRYYANLASLSTLVITLTEKEIRAAAALTGNERVQAGVEVDDVDKTYQEILKAVLEAKGHVTKSDVKQLTAGQFNATLNFEVPPDAAGPMRDRLKQLGRIARLEIDRVQNPEGGTLPTNAKLTRGDTVFMVQLYNLANIAPRETATLHIAVADVPTAFQTLRDVVGKTTGRVFAAKFDEQDRQNPTAQLDFEVRRADEGTARAALEAAGETFSRQLTRAPESDNVTDSKVLYRVSVISMTRLRPREIATMQVAVADVPAAYQALRAAAGKTTSRVLNAQLNEQDRQNISATLDIDVKRADEAAIRAAFDGSGEVLSRQTSRTPENEAATDSKTLYHITIISLDRLRPRETATLNVAVVDVPAAYQSLRDAIGKANGRVLNAQINEQDRQNISATLDLDVKRSDEAAIRTAFDAAGDVLSRQVTRVSETENVTDSKVRYTATLVAANRLRPRETTTLSIEVGNVDEAATLFAAQAAEVKGRQADAKFSRESSGKTVAKLVFEVPLTAAAGLVERFKSAGTVRVSQSVRDPLATEGRFATARIEVTLGNRDSIVADEDGLTSQVRRGLSYSATVLLTSVTWVIFGLCVILPWAIIGYVLYRVVRRMLFTRVNVELEAVPPPAPTTAPPATT